ncbi:MAG: hypothetical protein Q9O62_09110 [Ardenticatenia bacterium]|nr:hypothetical protein [Ardenticatenia bacterium]
MTEVTNTRTLLRRRLETLVSLTAGGILRRGAGEASRPPLEDDLTALWETEARLIRRVLAEPGDPETVLRQWRDRTERFRDRYPEREGWHDQQGTFWHVALVLTAIDNVLEHIEMWSTAVGPLDHEEGR